VLLETRGAWLAAHPDARSAFRFVHVSTDEVYGALGSSGVFSEETPYATEIALRGEQGVGRSLRRAYFHTYGLPSIITNCSNNYGPVSVSRETDSADDPERD